MSSNNFEYLIERIDTVTKSGDEVLGVTAFKQGWLFVTKTKLFGLYNDRQIRDAFIDIEIESIINITFKPNELLLCPYLRITYSRKGIFEKILFLKRPLSQFVQDVWYSPIFGPWKKPQEFYKILLKEINRE
jgi:hypothetical protein